MEEHFFLIHLLMPLSSFISPYSFMVGVRTTKKALCQYEEKSTSFYNNNPQASSNCIPLAII